MSTKLSLNLMPEEELVEYEKRAVQGLAEVLPARYEEVRINGLLRSLLDAIMEADKRAGELEDPDDPLSRAPRQGIAEYFRLLAQLSDPAMREAVKLAAGHLEAEINKEASAKLVEFTKTVQKYANASDKENTTPVSEENRRRAWVLLTAL